MIAADGGQTRVASEPANLTCAPADSGVTPPLGYGRPGQGRQGGPLDRGCRWTD